MKVLITGANGFVGKNLTAALRRIKDVEVLRLGRGHTEAALRVGLAQADVVFHLAGINRPQDVSEFQTGNVDLTRQICVILTEFGRTPKIIFSSSSQATMENPYGVSKLAAEKELEDFAEKTGADVGIYRLKNVFGKWCRPNYNSVVATFCYNIAHDIEITINDESKSIDLVYIDDIIEAFVAELSPSSDRPIHREVEISNVATVGELAQTIRSFRDIRTTLFIPNLERRFVQALYATYISYLDLSELSYELVRREDDRGLLAEVLKSSTGGQVFISRTHPGITRGNHYHNTKIEKFLVVEGDAVIRFRHVLTDEKVEFTVSGERPQIVDIAPGFTHNITNVGSGELVTLFWASEIFDLAKADTMFEIV